MGKQKERGEKNYRPNVAAIILSSRYPEKCEIFIASRSDIKDAWQFPQGGIDKDEDPISALYRELHEEIGTRSIEIIAEYPEWISYDFPESVADKMYPYDGQIQKYFLVRLKNSSSINLNSSKHPEFNSYKFVPFKKIFSYITYFKRPVYKKVLDHFKRNGYL